MDKFKIITSVDNIELDVKIGVQELERIEPRKIRVAYKIYQDECFVCEDDNNSGYICYATLSELIKKYCASREFKLIEYLCYQLYKIIKAQVKDRKIYIRVEKVAIKYREMVFDASAEYSDL